MGKLFGSAIADYNADITTTNNGGTLIDTGEAIVTITFGDRAAV